MMYSLTCGCRKEIPESLPNGMRTVTYCHTCKRYTYTWGDPSPMKYHSGDTVIITRVPSHAMPYVSVGSMATIVSPDDWVGEKSGFIEIRIDMLIWWWHVDDLEPADPSAINRPTGVDLNSLIHWVRRLVHADSGADVISAFSELARIEKTLPKEKS